MKNIFAFLMSRNVRYEEPKKIHINDNEACFEFVDFYLPDYDLYFDYLEGIETNREHIFQFINKKKFLSSLKHEYLQIHNMQQLRTLITFLQNNHLINIKDPQDPTSSIKVPLSHDKIFYTFQGEGYNAGVPSIFIRLAYCNLHCTWCDSFYTWKPDYLKTIEPPVQTSLFSILSEIINIDADKGNVISNVVITGGEPLIYQNNLQFLVYSLTTRGFSVEFETNGTIVPNSFLIDFARFNVSPKLEDNSIDTFSHRVKPAAINAFKYLPHTTFKFVIGNLLNFEAAVRDFIKPFNIPNYKIYLMPEGKTDAELSEKRLMVSKLCVDNGYNYTDRLHIINYGSKRGV